MAVSTEFTLSTYMRGILELSEDSYNVQDNTSVVRYKLKVYRSNSWSGQTYSTSCRRVINVNGQTVYDYTGEISHYLSEGTKTIAEGTVTVAHNDDGTKTVSGYASMDDPYGWFNGSSDSISLPLTTIPRASEPTIGQAGTNTPDFNLGDTITIYTNRKSSLFTHKVYITYDNTDHLIAQNVGVSTTLDTSAIEDAIAQLIPNAKTYAGTILLQTYNGSTLIGTKTCAYVAHLINADPTFADFSFRDANSTTVALTGNDQILVQNKSNLQVNISTAQKAVAKKHATMARYLMNCANLSESVAYSASAISKNLGAPTSTGTQTVGVSAIDSRENATLVTKPVSVVPYNAPQIFATGARVNGFENDTTITIGSNTAISPVKVNNVRKNSVQEFSYRYKKTTDSSYPATWTSIAHTVDADGKITASSFVISLDNQYEYEIQFKLTDALETSYATAVISEGVAIFRIGTDGNCYNNEHRILTENDLPLDASQIDLSTLVETVGSGGNVCYKFADGRMLALITLDENSAIPNGAWANIYETDAIYPPNYAVAFKDVPNCVVSLDFVGLQCWIASGSGHSSSTGLAGTKTRGPAVVLCRPSTFGSGSWQRKIHWQAWGRWK